MAVASSTVKVARMVWLLCGLLIVATALDTYALTFIEVHPSEPGGVEGLHAPVSVAVGPGGAHVYVANIGANVNLDFFESTVTVFSRNAATGRLALLEVHRNGTGGVANLNAAVALAVSPDGRHVYVANLGPGAIIIFNRDTTTGALTFNGTMLSGVDRLSSFPGQRPLTVSPDGRHLYYVGGDDDSLTVFSRDAITGLLTPVVKYQEGIGGVEGLDEPLGVIVSPDSRHVYVASGRDPQAPDPSAGGTVAVFSRDATTGALTLGEILHDGISGVDGIGQARAITISADGAHAYVASPGFDDTVAVFSRDGVTGRLAFIEVHRNGIGGIVGLDNPVDVIVSPDGAWVYVVAQDDNAVVAFKRNSTTGRLTFAEIERDGVGGVKGLRGASSVAATPDSAHIYVASDFAIGGGVVVFSTESDRIEVAIDIKPGEFPNSINPRSNGVIPVAILTTASFDATTVDHLSVEFGPNAATEAHGQGHIEDANGDGKPDLLLHFNTQDAGIQCRETSASLTGKTVSGQVIEGSDVIQTVGCK
jgi:6-phosphogluconolactonase (cycloisomerase 2 family)